MLWSARVRDPQEQEIGQGYQEIAMAEQEPAGQTKGKEGNAQAVEARTGNLRRVWDEVHLYRDNVRKTKVKLELTQ